MSKTIDQKVVEMQFDNKQFERNVSTTMSSIDKLKQSLNFNGASKGFENVEKAARSCDVSPLGTAVEAVRVKFSALEVMAVTALANITNSAVNAGKRIISALTLDPILTGFQEYETQINAVQTILANTESKGTTLSQVNAALAELNTYADQTIYNFTEMTRNIGTFTAAGVELDTAVSSIKGIANLAAVSGSNAQQASTAMYQLSQAIAAGKVQLMDWNSVVNAGMGGELFQNALKRTAEHFGYNVDAMIEKYGSFRESLTQGGWLTTEVLTETLTQLSGAYTEADLIAQGYTEEQARDIAQLAKTAVDAATKVKTFTQLWDTLKEAAQSGWTETWEILIGDFEEAKDLLTELSETFGEIIGKSADARNALLYDALASNWKKVSDEITEAGLSVDDFKDKIMQIAEKEGIDLDSIIAEYGTLEAAFKNGALSSDLMNKALEKMIGTSEQIAKKMADLRGELKTNDDIIKALTKAGYEYSDIQELITKNTNGETISLNDLSDAQLKSIGYTAEQIQSIRELSKYSELASGSIKEFIDNIAVPQGREMLIDSLRVSLRSLISIFETVGQAWRDVFPPMTSDQLLGIIQSIKDFTLAMRPTEETLNKLQRTFRGLFSVLSLVRKAFSAIISPVGDFLGSILGLGGGLLDTTAAIGDWITAIDKGASSGEIFASMSSAISSGLEVVLSAIRSVINGMDGFGGIVSSVFGGVLDVLGQVVGFIKDNISIGDLFAGLAGGGIFVAFKKLGSLFDKVKEIFESFGESSGSIKESFTGVLDSVHESLSNFSQGIQVASLVGIATAVTLLSSSLKKISEIEPAAIAYSLVTIKLLLMSLNSGFKGLTKTLSQFNSKGTIKASVAMIAMAGAINLLADAMVTLSDLSLGEVAKGLIGVAGGMAAMVAAMKVLNGAKVNLSTSVAMLALAQACKMLSEALVGFADLSWDEIVRGLTGMGGALAEVTVVMSVLSKLGGFKSVLGSLGILITVQSLAQLAEALKSFGGMRWDEIGRGLSGMGGALAEVGLVTGVLGKLAGFSSIFASGAILIVVQGLSELADALKSFGGMAWDEIGRGLTGMGGALAEVGVVTGALGKIAGFSSIFASGAIFIVIQGLGELANAFKSFGDMAWDEIGRGLVGMGGALAEVGVISGALGKLAGFSGLLGSGSLLIAIQGLGKLADALVKFGGMQWDEIGRGLVGMGGALVELGVISTLLGKLGGFGALVGSGSLLLGVQGLGKLADAFAKFGSMDWDEIGRGLAAMGGALAEVALGGLLSTFSGFGAGAIAEMAEPLGQLAESVKKWIGVTVPEGLGDQLASLAGGVKAFNFSGWGADSIATISTPLGAMADSVKKWSDVSIPENLNTQLTSLATGVSAFNFSGWGADAIAALAAPLGTLSDSVKKWSSVSIPDDLGTTLSGLASGVESFSFAFLGGWSISSLIEPLSSLADVMVKWNDVKIPEGIDSDLQSLADGVGAFNFSFFGGWSIGSVVEPLSELADAVSKWNGIDITGIGTGLSELATGLSAIGEVGVSGLISSLEGAATSAVNSINNIINGIQSAITSNAPRIETAFRTVIDGSIQMIHSKSPEFKMASELLMTQFTLGVQSKTSEVQNAFTATLSSVNQTIRSNYQLFYNAGGYLVDGFCAGMQGNMYKVTAKAREMANSAYNAAMAALDAHSPSRLFEKVGTYVPDGFAIGIVKRQKVVSESATAMSEAAINSTKKVLAKIGDYVDDKMNTKPVIRPVLDLSDVQSKMGALNSVFARRQVSAISATVGSNDNVHPLQPEASSSGVKYQFVQNNYSPKALSRVEIYRQTKNQFSAFERVVKA